MNLGLNINQKSSLNLSGLKKVLSVIILAAFLFLTWSLLLSPQYSEFQITMDKKNQILAELADVDQQIREIEALSIELDAMAPEDIDKLEKSLPIGEGLEDFLATMHRLALQSELTIISIFVTPSDITADQATELRKSQLSLTLRGGYVGVLSFLQLLQQHVRVVDIRSLAITDVTAGTSGSVAGPETLQVNLSADVYNLAAVPETPLFPYGKSFDTTLFSSQQFKSVQVIATALPTGTLSLPNPFSP